MDMNQKRDVGFLWLLSTIYCKKNKLNKIPDKCLSHPQCVVDGVLLLILGHHQCEGVCPCAGQPHLGQVMWAVDADAVDVRRGVGCGGSLLIVNKPESSRRAKLWE